MALSPPPQYAALAPDERVVLAGNNGVGLGVGASAGIPSNTYTHPYSSSYSSRYTQQQQGQGNTAETGGIRINFRYLDYTNEQDYSYRQPSSALLPPVHRTQGVEPIVTDDTSMMSMPTPELTPASTVLTDPSSVPMSAASSSQGPGPSSGARMFPVYSDNTEYTRGRSLSRKNEGSARGKGTEKEENTMMGMMMQLMEELGLELSEKDRQEQEQAHGNGPEELEGRGRERERGQRQARDDETADEGDEDEEEDEDEEDEGEGEGEHKEEKVKIKEEEDEEEKRAYESFKDWATLFSESSS